MKRSAFTFCEEVAPSRIDFGKDQYGGPFSTEEVEDVKTFLRLLLLLVTLFGYHVAGDGFAIVHHMQQYSCCPSLIVWELFSFNPTSTTSLIVLISIPVLKCLPNIHKYTPNMLKRIGIGLILLVLQELIYIFLSLPSVIADASTANVTDFNVSNSETQCMLVVMNTTNAVMIHNVDYISSGSLFLKYSMDLHSSWST